MVALTRVFSSLWSKIASLRMVDMMSKVSEVGAPGGVSMLLARCYGPEMPAQ